MKSQGEKFPFKKILEYILKQQGGLNALRAFLKNTAEGEQKSISTIKQFTNENAEICNKLKLKQITKLVMHFSIHNLQTEQIPNIIQLIEHKLYFWIDELMEQLKSLKDKAKAIETKKNTITQFQINAFKDELTKELISINQRKQSLIRLYCHNTIKNNSQQLERITDLLKNQLETQNKEKRQRP